MWWEQPESGLTCDVLTRDAGTRLASQVSGVKKISEADFGAVGEGRGARAMGSCGGTCGVRGAGGRAGGQNPGVCPATCARRHRGCPVAGQRARAHPFR